MFQKRPLWRAGVISFILHTLALFFSLSRGDFTSSPPENSDSKKALSVRSLTEKEFDDEIKALEKLQNTGIIVQSDDQLKSDDKPRNTSEEIFLSKHNQRVDKNTRAARVGEFKNVLEEGLEEGSAKKDELAKEQQKTKISKLQEKLLRKNFIKEASNEKRNLAELEQDPSRLFALANPELSDNKAPELRSPSSILDNEITRAERAKKGEGLSATDDFLQGVTVGPNTLLNTQEYKYYNFYERIRQMLVERWRTRIRREIDRARSPASENKLHVGTKITKLNVHMNENGEIVSIERTGMSGIESFDQSAEVAFREAAPFPHPPAEMLKNGELSVNWDFVVVVEESSLIEFKVQRAPR